MREVRDLLGVNLPDLKLYENNTVAHSWISRQLQSELDTLEIGLTGGRQEPTATTASPNANVTTGANATTSKPTGTHTCTGTHTYTTTHTHSLALFTGAGSSISASSGLQKLLLLGVTMATLQLIN